MADENENNTADETKVEEQETKGDASEAKGKGNKPKRERDNKPVEFAAAPDEAEYKITVNKLEKGVEAITKKIDQLNMQIKEQGDIRQEFRNQKKEVIEKLRTIKKSKEALYAERNIFQEKVVAIETERKNRKEKTTNLRASLKFLKVEEIDKAVAAIEYRLSTSNNSLKKEKELIAEIKELKKQKDVVKQYEDAKTHEEAETFDTKELREKRDAKNKEIRIVRDAEQEHQTKMQDLRTKENAANDKVKEHVLQRRNSNNEARELKKEGVQVKIEFEKQSRAHKRYVDYTSWVKRQDARKKRQERIEAEKKWREEQVAAENGDAEDESGEPKVKAHPYEKEMYLCTELSRYLRRIAPQSDDNSKNETAEEKSDRLADERNAGFKGKDGVVLGPGKKKKEEFFPGAASKKKGGGKKKRQGLTTLTHIPDVFAQFASLNIEIPMNIGAVPKALKALSEKEEYFKTAPAPLDNKEKKKLSEKQAKEAGDKSEEAKDREEAKQRAKALVDEEQARRVKEAADGEAADKAERAQNQQAAIAATDSERERRVAEEKSAQDKASAESRAARDAADKATVEEQQLQVAEFPEKQRKKSIVQEMADAQAAAAAAEV